MAATPTSAPWLYGATLQHTHVFDFSSNSTHGSSTGASSVCSRWSSPETSSTVVSAAAASVSSGCMLSSLPSPGHSSDLVKDVCGEDHR